MTRTKLVSASILILLFLLVPLVLLAPTYAAENLLTNPGFEDGTAEWSVSASTVTFEATSSATKSGSYSGLVTKKSSKSWGYIYREVEATPSAEYKFSGWVYFNDLAVRYVKLRIDWRDAGGERAGLSEIKLEDRSSDFQKISLTATAPVDAIIAKVEAFVYLDSPGPKDPVLFDDLKLEIVPPFALSFTIPDEVTAGEGFDVPVEVSNADPGSEYYVKALVGESTESASLRKGYTYNSVLDKWLAWNGSWSKMPTFTTGTDGSASFTLKSKVKDDVPSGTYYYLVRLRKIGTDDNLDSAAQAFFVNESSGTSSTSGPSGPEISFLVEGDSLRVNQKFDVKIDIKNAKPLHDYYVKVRLGLSESKLTKGRTYNSFYDSWLWDGKAWKDFPVAYTASDGAWEGIISAKVTSGNPADTYYIEVRLRDKETEKNYDSETQTVEIGEEDLTSYEEDNPDGEGEVLGAMTELPATGGGGIGVTNLFVIVWLPVLGWMLLIFIGSSLPGASVSENRTVDFAAHKLVHLFEYSVLFALIYRAIKKSLARVRSLSLFILSFIPTIIFAVTDEIHQFFVRGRDARVQDVLIDAVAAFLGWLIVRRKKDKLNPTK